MPLTTTLGELIELHGGLIQTGPFGSQLHQRDYSDEGIPFVMPKDIRDGRIDENTVARVPEAKAQHLARHLLKTGSIVFPRRGEISKCAYIDEAQAGFLCGSGCLKIEPPQDVLLPRFLYYYLGLREVVEWLERNAVGTTMLNLNSQIVAGIEIPMLPLNEQVRIAAILSAYDDLIEANRRRIVLLEQAARLIYREWFVHLRFPGHEAVRVVDGVPAGWERKTLGDVSSFISRGITPKYDDDAAGIVINQKCIRDRLVTLDLARRQSKEVPSEKLVQYGDVLINSTGEGTLGRVAQFYQSIENCTVDSHVTIARAEQDIPTFLYGYQVMALESVLAVSGRGATNQTELSRSTVAESPFLLPSPAIGEQFELTVKSFIDQMQNLLRQNQQLATARDLLLPRLMSGEIEV